MREQELLLLDAAKRGSVPDLRKALKDGAIVNIRSDKPESLGQTALMIAAKLGKHAFVKELLRSVGDRVSVNVQDKKGYTALMLVAKYNKDTVEVLNELLNTTYGKKKEIDITLTNLKKMNALMIAAEKGNSSFIDTLNEKLTPVQLNEKLLKKDDSIGKSALVRAIRNGHVETVNSLLRLKNIKTKYVTPKWLLCQDEKVLTKEIIESLFAETRDPIKLINEGQDLDLIELLLKAGRSYLKLNVSNLRIGKNTNSIVELLEKYGYFENKPEPDESEAPVIEQLKDLNIDEYVYRPNDKRVNIGRVLCEAAYSGFTDVVKRLIEECGVPVDIRDADGGTALLNAVELGYKKGKDIIEYLLRKGADPNIATTDRKDTPLMVAVEVNSPDAAKLLLENGANIDMRNKDGKSALEMARSDRVRAVLRSYADSATDTQRDIREQLASVVDADSKLPENQLEKLLDVYVYSKGDVLANDVLCYAVRNNYVRIIKKLIDEKKVPVDGLCEKGITALMEAVICGNKLMVKLLLDRNADVNMQSKSDSHGGYTAMMYAINGKLNEDIFKILLKAGADLDKIRDDKYEMTARDHMRWSRDLDKMVFFHDYFTDKSFKRGYDVTRLLFNELEISLRDVSIEKIKKYIEAGADLNSSNDGKWEPLGYVIEKCLSGSEVFTPEVVELFLQHGANPNGVYHSKEKSLEDDDLYIKSEITYLQYAQQYSNERGKEIVRLLKKYGAR